MPDAVDLAIPAAANLPSVIEHLADIPEEEIWLAKQKSARTRRAYKLDVQHFMQTLRIRTYDELRRVDHRAVIAWERIIREIDGAAPSTVRRRLSPFEPFQALDPARLRRDKSRDGSRASGDQPRGRHHTCFSKDQARMLLDTPAHNSIDGLRDRAILAVGLQIGLRRAKIAALKVGDLHKNRGFDSLRVIRKGGRRDALAIHPNAVKRIQAYLDAAGHGEDLEGPLFRPLSDNRKIQSPRRAMHPDAIDRVLRKHAKALGLDRGYSAHSMRATFITTAR